MTEIFDRRAGRRLATPGRQDFPRQAPEPLPAEDRVAVRTPAPLPRQPALLAVAGLHCLLTHMASRTFPTEPSQILHVWHGNEGGMCIVCASARLQCSLQCSPWRVAQGGGRRELGAAAVQGVPLQLGLGGQQHHAGRVQDMPQGHGHHGARLQPATRRVTVSARLVVLTKPGFRFAWPVPSWLVAQATRLLTRSGAPTRRI